MDIILTIVLFCVFAYATICVVKLKVDVLYPCASLLQC